MKKNLLAKKKENLFQNFYAQIKRKRPLAMKLKKLFPRKPQNKL